MVKKNGETEILRCSFCNKDQNDVRKLIAGPTVFICDECVEVCNDIIADDNRFENRGVRSSLPSPPEIKKFLDEYVIGQERTKKKLAGRRSTTTTSGSRSRSSRAAATTSS
jgi:ATP-dependent Clp protease ATP-binding subunit ClpX